VTLISLDNDIPRLSVAYVDFLSASACQIRFHGRNVVGVRTDWSDTRLLQDLIYRPSTSFRTASWASSRARAV
jgi:hypothetical protein